MTHVLVNHKVQDYEAWKAVFDNFVETRKTSGEKAYHIFYPDGSHNNLTLLFEWDSRENAESFFKSDKLKQTMQKAGVAEEPKIQFLQEAAQGTL
jgi:quinol monooxygenase YgiN